MKPFTLALLPAVAIVTLVGCSSSGGQQSTAAAEPSIAPTSHSESTTTAPVVESSNPVTTIGPTVTAGQTTIADGPTPIDVWMAMFWRSRVDDSRVDQSAPAPSVTSGEITVSVEFYVLQPADAVDCQAAAEHARLAEPEPCLLVQAHADVPADTHGDAVSVSLADAVTAEGNQVACGPYAFSARCSFAAAPGSDVNVLVGAFPGAGAGTTLRFAIGDESNTRSIVVPPYEEFRPIEPLR